MQQTYFTIHPHQVRMSPVHIVPVTGNGEEATERGQRTAVHNVCS